MRLILLFMSLALVTAHGQVEAKKAAMEKGNPDAEARLAMARVQIFLDRANFRPGKIDGLGGEFTQKAANRYALAHGLDPGALLDTSAISDPYRDYTVVEADMKWIGPVSSKPGEMAKYKALKYGNLWELVAERFHCDLEFLKELNPSLANGQLKSGDVVRVPDVEPFYIEEVAALEKQRAEEALARKKEKEAKEAAEKAAKQSAEQGDDEEVATASVEPTPQTPLPTPTPEPTPKVRLKLYRADRLIEVYRDDKLSASMPCTPGSDRVPVVLGQWKVTSNVLLPYFRWDKSVLESGVRSENFYNLAPGPNNPVGIVWLGINRKSIGIHGTNHPDAIGRNQSSGCIRTANWDAWLLAQWVSKDTPLEVVE